MQTHMQTENSSIYPLPVKGNCYFISDKVSLIGQYVDVGLFSTLIDSGQASTAMSIHFGCSQAHQNDEAIMFLGYLGKSYLLIGTGPGNILE
jgi:hypothetical protein